MSKKKVHIVGTHGVPAKYGGFETLADMLCKYLKDDFEITVYCNSSKYPEKPKEYNGAKLIYVPINASGFKGIFYDIFTYIHALIKSDIILYLSPVGSGFIIPLKKITRKKVLVNHGGLNEWEREKLNGFKKKWAKFNHRIAAKFADVNITDNYPYQKSLKHNFDAVSVVIPYGGNHVKLMHYSENGYTKKYPFLSTRYAVSISRAQKDNNIHLLLEAFSDFKKYKLVVVSNWEVSEYGKKLKSKYKNTSNIILLDAIYDKNELDVIRGNSYLYIHSHSRCGTAPSLVEAMNLKRAVISFDVETNRETTKNQSVYFKDKMSLISILEELDENSIIENREKMYAIASQNYTWESVAQQYKENIEFTY